LQRAKIFFRTRIVNAIIFRMEQHCDKKIQLCTNKRRMFSLVQLLEPRGIKIQLSECWFNLIHRFNPATFVCLFQAITWISNAICHGGLCVQWFDSRCSFCWYRWNCCQSLFLSVGSVLLIFLVFCVVLLCIFAFVVPCCDVRYEFCIKTMFCSVRL
jgi:hypothetical protein